MGGQGNASQRVRRGGWLAPLGAGMLLALAVVLVVGRPAAPPHAASAAELQAYANDVAKLTAPAGQVVVTDMKPSVRSWESGSLASSVLAARAGSWAMTFRRTRTALVRVSPPAGMDSAQAGFLSALDAYAGAADLFRAATGSPTAEEIGRATTAARGADAIYASASAILQRALRDAGLAPDVRFPAG